jgi:hypothetical protein
MTHRSLLRLFTFVAAAFVAVGLFADSARAQGAGVRAGVQADPDQFYFGAHAETTPLIDRLTFRPNLEIGVGNDFTTMGFNFEFAYHFASTRPWNVYVGGGPALVTARHRGASSSGGGFNLLVGAQHSKGLFTEVKIGSVDSPSFKFGVGYAVKWK